MPQNWADLTQITQGKKVVVERIGLMESQISIEGQFELPPLATLTMEDQVFVTAFIRNHGSIKEMEQLFGVSYPTIKNRLNKIAEQLEFVVINPPPTHAEILARLERGEISAKKAAEELKK